MGKVTARGRPTADEQGRRKKMCTFRLAPDIVEFMSAMWNGGNKTRGIEDAIRRCQDFKKWMEERR